MQKELPKCRLSFTFQDFPGIIVKFQDFPGIIVKFQDFP